MIIIDIKAETIENKKVIKKIEQYKAYLTKQQYKTLIGKAKAGNREAAVKGLNKLLMRVARDSHPDTQQKPKTQIWRAD